MVEETSQAPALAQPGTALLARLHLALESRDGLSAEVQLEVPLRRTVGALSAGRPRIERSQEDRTAFAFLYGEVEAPRHREITPRRFVGRQSGSGEKDAEVVGKQTMNPFKAMRLTWWQAGLLKLSMVALGLAVGSTWPEVFGGWREVLLVLFVVPAFYVSYVWLKQI